MMWRLPDLRELLLALDDSGFLADALEEFVGLLLAVLDEALFALESCLQLVHLHAPEVGTGSG